MSKYEQISTVLSILAAILSVATAFYSGSISKRLATSDYKATEEVKSDTAKLLSALRSLMHKGALSTSSNRPVDLSPEQAVISNFLNSQTGFAYYSWIDEKSSRATAQGRREEPWRVFFLYLVELENADDAYSAARRAADVELIFDQLTEDDVAMIASFNEDLISAISKNSRNREGNIVVKALVESQRDRNLENSSERFSAKLHYLKKMGIQDPNIDMFLATIFENASLLESALQAGADPKTTDRALLDKYARELQSFVG